MWLFHLHSECQRFGWLLACLALWPIHDIFGEIVHDIIWIKRPFLVSVLRLLLINLEFLLRGSAIKVENVFLWVLNLKSYLVIHQWVLHENLHVSHAFHDLHNIEFRLNPVLASLIEFHEAGSSLEHFSTAAAAKNPGKVEFHPVFGLNINVSMLQDLVLHVSGGALRDQVSIQVLACSLALKHLLILCPCVEKLR